jgi:hypothetical protein
MFYILICFYLWIYGTLNKISISIFQPLKKVVTLPDPLPENVIEDRRLWIGNLDPRVTE